MTQDVKQWLTEIKLLQQKVAAAQQERDQAYASAANWRNLYETEAKQRRAEANLAQQTIETLDGRLQELQSLSSGSEPAVEMLETIQAEVGQLQNVDELRGFLVKALAECDRLTRALKAEQIAHAETRKTLTSALGDTVDLLAKERGTRKHTEDSTRSMNGVAGSDAITANQPFNGASKNGASATRNSELKVPSLELPQFD
jgi:chromosome segregation ATPase